MSLKQSLKSAKAAIERNDPEDALGHASAALELDKKCYFAYIFQGKSYQLLSQLDKAAGSFEKATTLEPDNLLGWKGYFQVARCSDNFDHFFHVLTSYLRTTVAQNLPIAEIVKDVYNYLNAHDYKSNSLLNEKFLRMTLPGTELGELLGGSMGTPAENIKRLIASVKSQEDLEVRQAVAKEKLKLPRVLNAQSKAHLNQLEWSIRSKSDLSALYALFLNHCDDDALRREYEAEFLKYKYALLKIVPEKGKLLEEIKEMADDMVLLGTNDLFTWSLNFDLNDPKTVGDIDQRLLLSFVQKFPNEGLSLVLYSYVMSEMCPFDKEPFKRLAIGQDESVPEPLEGDILDTDVFEVDASPSDKLSSSEVLELMLSGYAKCSNSMLAHRIICNYYIYLQEYEAGSEKCINVVRQLAELQRTYGIDLVHCKEDVLCSLAIVYTYHEAPKNFSRALQLYDKILKDTPDNKMALIGKGLILVAKRELDKASSLLTQVVHDFSTDSRALMELGWCLILQEKFEDGRSKLEEALIHVEGVSSKSFTTRANIRWRLAKSYMMEDSENENNLKMAYDLLILSLKDSKSYAPSYTLLGEIYYDHYDDKIRASKCFFKAFELDVSEVTAARYLVQDLAEKKDWDITEILCKRVVTSEKSKRILFSNLFDNPDKSWPYRVLGCSALNKQDDAKAIEWFQTALRMQAMDTECWLGLGEAYFNCGRMDAAIKVFQHTTKLAPSSWPSWYMLGKAVCMVGDYSSGLEVLQKALDMKPGCACILNALYEQSIMYSSQLLRGGFVKKTLVVNKLAIDYILQSLKVNKMSLSLWKALGDCIKLICKVQQDIADSPFDVIAYMLQSMEGLDDELVSTESAREELNRRDYVKCYSMLCILAARAAIATTNQKSHKLIRSYTQFNLGLAYLDAFNFGEEGDLNYRECAVKAFREAIRLEPGNAQFWIALGNASVSYDPSLAQHCFIKASIFDNREVTIWSNLAALYLRYGDPDLAQEAFDRATSLAPESSTPWLGNSLTAEVLGDNEKSSRLTTHAYILSNGRSPLAQLCYANSVVNNRIGHAKDQREVEAAQEFSIANFAIQSFLKFQPNNETGLKLALVLSERCYTHDMCIEVGTKLAQLLEDKFEQTENPEVLLDVAKTKTSLARVYLGMEDYELAIENAQFTLDLLSEEETTADIQRALLSSRIVIGLAFFFNGQYDEALQDFQKILDEHSSSQTAVTLVAQVLSALGTEESKQAALDQLFRFIEEHGSSLIVILTLGAISVANNFEDYYLPIKEELENLSLKELIGDNFRLVPQLLEVLSARVDGSDGSFIWKKFALLFPSDFNVWKRLNAHMALSTSLLTESKRTAMEVSEAYAKKASRRELQRALLLCADNRFARHALVNCS